MSELCITHIENYWKTKTKESNVLFDQRRYEEALSGYKDALYRAEVLNTYQSDCIRDNVPFIQIYVISCNNMVNTYEELNSDKEAEKILKRLVCYLLCLTDNDTLNHHETKVELKKAIVTYINFVHKNGGDKKELETLFNTVKREMVAMQ
ncbi:tetratricopeptide repeat protein [Aquimarina aquimarini]|uniref:tetratricopeptide repeat protein n=1 Tax=Aquimarina aquimarini TaxID=1191734 RepID=UPI000D55AB1C|nr:tetratricopeptide repeat protein [Aquimarina aquimarini]